MANFNKLLLRCSLESLPGGVLKDRNNLSKCSGVGSSQHLLLITYGPAFSHSYSTVRKCILGAALSLLQTKQSHSGAAKVTRLLHMATPRCSRGPATSEDINVRLKEKHPLQNGSSKTAKNCRTALNLGFYLWYFKCNRWIFIISITFAFFSPQKKES